MRNEVIGRALGALVLALVAGSARAEVIQIRIEKMAFVPAQVSAHVGDTIEWMNADFLVHTATARNGSWDLLLPVKAKKSTVLKSAGTIDYYCKLHPTMTGKITVE